MTRRHAVDGWNKIRNMLPFSLVWIQYKTQKRQMVFKKAPNDNWP